MSLCGNFLDCLTAADARVRAYVVSGLHARMCKSGVDPKGAEAGHPSRHATPRTVARKPQNTGRESRLVWPALSRNPRWLAGNGRPNIFFAPGRRFCQIHVKSIVLYPKHGAGGTLAASIKGGPFRTPSQEKPKLKVSAVDAHAVQARMSGLGSWPAGG